MLLLPEADMERTVPWKELEEEVRPVAARVTPGAAGGRPAYPVNVMLRIYLCQTWYNLSDDGMEDTIYDSESVRRQLSGRRAIGEHPFHVIKNIFGYTKVRYRGIKKNSLRLNILCMLSNLYLMRRVLLAS